MFWSIHLDSVETLTKQLVSKVGLLCGAVSLWKLWFLFFFLFFCYQLWCLIAGGACSVCDYLSAAEGHDGYHLWSHTKVSFFLKKKKVSIWTIIQVAYNIIMVSREMAVPYDPLESGFIVPAPLQVICSTLLLLRRPFFFLSLLVSVISWWCACGGRHCPFVPRSTLKILILLRVSAEDASFTNPKMSLHPHLFISYSFAGCRVRAFANLFCSSRATG